MKLLWISDTPDGLYPLADQCGDAPVHCADPSQALALLASSHFEGVVVRTPVPEWTPGEVVVEIHRANRALPVIVIAAENNAALAFHLAQTGADAVLGADAGAEELRDVLDRVVGGRKSWSESETQPWRKLLVGDSQSMRGICEVVRLIGPRKCTVLITGETGTGKEMVARAIHMAGERSRMPLVAVNCTALPDQLLEAELFGHVRGAFTGATNHRTGRFEQANRGTLFLDEVGDMPIDLQAKLLRVLQEREFQRVGSSETVKVDVRFIAASNANLEEEIAEGHFREDLFYRLNVVPIEMPPLRERAEDIPLLADHFIEKICGAEDIPAKRITHDALQQLMAYDWPGNVRQLENAIETAVVLSGERVTLHASDFRLPSSRARRAPAMHVVPSVSVPDHGLDFERTVGRIEREILEQALQKTNGNKKRAAEMLRLKRTTLAAKLKSLEAIAC